MIKIVGLGPGSIESLTLGTVNLLKSSPRIYLRTEKHPTVKYLRDLNIEFETYDITYETEKSFEDVYEIISHDLILKESKYGDIVYAVPGHPLVAEKSVTILLDLCRGNHIETRVYPSVSFIDAIFEALGMDIFENLRIVDAFDIKSQTVDKRCGIIITQVYDKFIASDVKLALMDYYKQDINIYFIRAAGIKGLESIRKIKLYELDRQCDIDYLTSIYIPRNSEAIYNFTDLLNIMDTLRGENGCPWDRKQNHESLKKYLIEESYEVLEAIEDKDDSELTEELGDVLFQVVFHSQIGKEEGFFDINSVINTVCKKMIERHPHVFGNAEVKDSEEVLTNWEEIKKNQQGLTTYTQQLKHIPKILPALMRAYKVQEKASKVGFDFNSVEDTLDKVAEEYHELRYVYNSKERVKIVEEMGDLIFASVNVARFLDIDPEFALNYTIEKFIKRFAYIENKAKSMQMSMQEMTSEEMNKFWIEAKSK
ncbi:MAG: nucleoside triphosphate pyrophosphohydrolase [Clostridium sp.]|jgi:tetrapyrrole methylase family protein/MazG family protein|uniref:nucleoside triphosphate pyrophosphohydrolase n=1 Tax=Clostridium sp. TaxID=1506 RepID=UPI0025C17D71|nr:nucleoside triphosphate pyrophosphohydrolase [Clostridium sp.]MCH3965621.1 nucleoside triphosphate pyrophosphohydrolase [Clostridium sp.]MCI1717130.1 nucleoside triphosphate pyrophosphohydrolase [Clostridium sp.]MCI1801465.1 nucleoside triphosphate pyrophosphohydrolase [Clostridium sp.]MCI1815316.1 nucleoside triphosphate pyrophosphohydrolase [Clostridium sp.]MCI1872214.1 nucleoside triphosphate pyrophosphohydrolase [Clostridium sp.]